MATTPTIPGGGAAPAAAAPASAPAASPAPVATPAAPATPVTPAAPQGPSAGESKPDFIKRLITERTKPGETAAVTAPVAEKPAAVAEPKPGEAAPAEAKPAEAAPAEPAVEAEGIQFAEDELAANALDLPTPKELAKSIEGNPELKAALDKSPEVRDRLFRSSRILSEAAPILEMFPTPQAAQFASEQTQLLTEMRDTMMYAAAQEDPAKRTEGFQNFMALIGAETFLHDDQTGELLLDGNNQPISDGTLESWLSYTMQSGLDALAAEATSSENTELSEALKTVMDAVAKRGSSTSSDEIPEHLKAREAAAEQREKALQAREQTAAREQREHLEETFRQKCGTEGEKAIDMILDRYPGVPDYVRDKAKADIRSTALAKLVKDPHYISQRDFLITQPQTKEVQEQRVALFRAYFKNALLGAYRPIMQKATQATAESAAGRDAKRSEQMATSRSEPKGATAAPLPQPELTGDQAVLSFREEFRKQNGRWPSTLEMHKELVRKSGAVR